MKTLFLALGNSPVAWYRCGLPANALGWDWLGIAGHPSSPYILSGNIEEYKPEDYDVIIVQQLSGDGWKQQIEQWQAEGKKVVYEIDDFVHGINRIEGHVSKKLFAKKVIKTKYVPIMRQCDAMICSTEFLSDQYKKYNENQFVCKNSIDVDRYNVEFPPERDTVVIGWSGGTGHHLAVGPWLEEVSKILNTFDNARFVSMGIRYADALGERHPGKCLSIPWTTLENYPYSLTNFDIYIAPAHESKYFLSKSDLRWLEASAVGIAGVVDPRVYKDVQDGTDALTASTPLEAGDAIMELVDNESLRKEIASNAKKNVKSRDIKKGSEQWSQVISQLSSQ